MPRAAALLLLALLAGCGSAPPEELPPAAEPASSPPLTARPDGRLVPVGHKPEGAVADPETGLVAVGLRAPDELALVDGASGEVVVAKVRETGDGYNAATGLYGDLVAQGVLDPVKVTRSALANAASITAMLLTTETLIVEKPAEEADSHAGHSH